MTHPFSDLLERSNKPSRMVVGMMSGTSADSIDVAVCRMKGRGPEVRVELVHYREHAHDPEVNRQVLGAVDLDVRAIAELNVRVGEAFAAACLATLHEAGLSPGRRRLDRLARSDDLSSQRCRGCRAGPPSRWAMET